MKIIGIFVAMLASGFVLSPVVAEAKPSPFTSGMCPMTPPDKVGNANEARLILFASPKQPTMAADLRLFNAERLLQSSVLDQMMFVDEEPVFIANSGSVRTMIKFVTKESKKAPGSTLRWMLIYNAPESVDLWTIQFVGPCIEQDADTLNAAVEQAENMNKLIKKTAK